MLRLEGNINGRQVCQDCNSVDAVTAVAANLLPAVDGARLLFILGTLRLAAQSGRWWAWSSEGFNLTLVEAPNV